MAGPASRLGSVASPARVTAAVPWAVERRGRGVDRRGRHRATRNARGGGGRRAGARPRIGEPERTRSSARPGSPVRRAGQASPTVVSRNRGLGGPGTHWRRTREVPAPRGEGGESAPGGRDGGGRRHRTAR